jgi:hypothetical protein
MIGELIDLEAEKKHNKEVLNWCDEHGYNKFVAALILAYDFDYTKNDNFKILKSTKSLAEIKYDNHIYKVFDNDELDNMITSYQRETEKNWLVRIPVEMHSYIDWDDYWDTHYPDIYEFCAVYVAVDEDFYETLYIKNIDNDR